MFVYEFALKTEKACKEIQITMENNIVILLNEIAADKQNQKRITLSAPCLYCKLKAILQRYEKFCRSVFHVKVLAVGSTARDVQSSVSVIFSRVEQHSMWWQSDYAVEDLREKLTELYCFVKSSIHYDQGGLAQ